MDSNGGKRDEALNKIRLQFGPSITKNFMEDIHEDDEEEDETEEVSFVDKVKSFFTSFTDKAMKSFERYTILSSLLSQYFNFKLLCFQNQN